MSGSEIFDLVLRGLGAAVLVVLLLIVVGFLRIKISEDRDETPEDLPR